MKKSDFFFQKCVRVISLYFFMMKLLALSINTHPWNISGFITSGSTFISYFRKLNLRKELNLSQILLEVYETLQLYSACQNEQKSQRWPPSIFYRFRDKNPRSLRRLIFTKNTNMNGNLFCCIFLFLTLHSFSFQNFSIIFSLFFILVNFWNFSIEMIWRFNCLVSVPWKI